ncbi:MAG: hypothetical protein AB1Z98_07145 [Nannocystaceae bacterium]
MFLGAHLTLLIGPTILAPAPESIARSIEQVSVTQSETSSSGFQVTFKVGRDMFTGWAGYQPLLTQQIKAGHRVALVVRLGLVPFVLIDGFIDNVQLSPGADPGTSTLTISGSDVSAMMELVESQTQWPNHSRYLIVQQILLRYAALMTPIAIPPRIDPPMPMTDGAPSTSGNDLAVVRSLAEQVGYIFSVRPGVVPGQNFAYWGPQFPGTPPQSALSFRMGPATNLSSIQFQQKANVPAVALGLIQESNTGAPLPVVGIPPPPMMGLVPSWAGGAPLVRIRSAETDEGGDIVLALDRASAQLAIENRNAITASGELDVLRYGRPLIAGLTVGVRGVGTTNDGLWKCTSVTHTIGRGSYKQSFQLERDATISNTPVVMP